jgi:hypothetical protein
MPIHPSNSTFLRQFDERQTVLYHVRLLGIRGYFEDVGDVEGFNDLGVYDDAIVRVIGTDVTVWRASCDPGWLCIRGQNQGANSKGCALMLNGTHLYKLGKHDGHEALNPAETIYVKRLNRDGSFKEGKSTGGGINIHSGGPDLKDVGPFSAGCQIVYSREGYFGKTWLKFFEPLRDAMKANGQKIVPYKLMMRSELA